MIGIKSATILGLVAMTFIAAPLLRADYRMRPGLWEITTTLDGKPSGTHANCYTPAMVETVARHYARDIEKFGYRFGQ